MKTFKQLSIGDKIFVIKIEEQEPIKNFIIVRNIDFNGEALKINYTRGYGTDYYDLVVPQELVNEHHLSDIKGYRGFYFTDLEMVDAHVKNLVIGLIKKAQQKIIDCKIEEEERIIKLRKKYHEILNRSSYPDFTFRALLN